jgi:hypothetical protein
MRLRQTLCSLMLPSVRRNRWLPREPAVSCIREYAMRLRLGWLYESGVSGVGAEAFVPKDLALSYFWYSLAAAHGDPPAKKVFNV